MTPKQAKARKIHAFVDGRLVVLQPTVPCGVERHDGGPFRDEWTEVSYPVGDERMVERVRSWQPSEEPIDEVVELTAELVRERFKEAMLVLDRIPLSATDRPSTKMGGNLPVVHSIVSAYGYAMIEAKAPPSADEISRMDQCLTWLWLIPSEWRKAVIGIARRVPLRKIAKVMRCSHEYARSCERKGVELIALLAGDDAVTLGPKLGAVDRTAIR